MIMLQCRDIAVHIADSGDPDGRPVVFANSLGTDLRLWDPILPLLPDGLRIIRYDKCGHGLTDRRSGPYSIAMLARDVEVMLEELEVARCLFVGLSIGGCIALQLAATRPDLVAAVVISNSAARIGNRAMWDERIRKVQSGGTGSIADSIVERWFSENYRINCQLQVRGWRNMVSCTSRSGYSGCCEALKSADLRDQAAAIRIPALAIAGTEDVATPPDLVRHTASLVDGCSLELVSGAGHLACAESPERYAEILNGFMNGDLPGWGKT